MKFSKIMDISRPLPILVVSLVMMMASCKRLIEIPSTPHNQLSTKRVFSDSANILAAIAGVYSNFGASSGSLQFASGMITVYTGLTADELVPAGDIYTAPIYYNNSILPDDHTVQRMWQGAYQNIYQINLCLEGIAGTQAISEDLRRQLMGELAVDRAFHYFNLVNLWGGVPIITATDYQRTQSIPRASKDSVLQFIVSDLLEAVSKLNPAYPSTGRARPNLYVAQALLAKVYLYLGAYEKAIAAASSVIGAPVYQLETTPDNVFLNGSTEAIWQLPANGNYQGVPEAGTFIAYNATSAPNYALSPYLLAAFESDDLRKASWTSFSTVPSGSGSTVFYYPYKYRNVYPGATPLEDYMLLRLADIYLIRAEALANGGHTEDALADLDLVRARAGLDPSAASTKEAVVEAILHERQVELFAEWGNRWFDLKRTNTIDAVLGQEKPKWEPRAALFPIPTAEIQANPFLTPNP